MDGRRGWLQSSETRRQRKGYVEQVCELAEGPRPLVVGRLWCTAVRRGSVVNSSYGVGALLVGETLETTPCVLHTILFNQQHCAVEHNVVPVVAEVVHVHAGAGNIAP